MKQNIIYVFVSALMLCCDSVCADVFVGQWKLSTTVTGEEVGDDETRLLGLEISASGTFYLVDVKTPVISAATKLLRSRHNGKYLLNEDGITLTRSDDSYSFSYLKNEKLLCMRSLGCFVRGKANFSSPDIDKDTGNTGSAASSVKRTRPDSKDQAARSDKRAAMKHVRDGAVRFSANDFTGAIKHWDKAIEISPGYVVPYYNRGAAKMKLGDIDGATADYNKAIELNPKFLNAYIGLGYLYFEVNDLEKAETNFREVLGNLSVASKEEEANAYSGLAMVSLAKGDMVAAKDNYKMAVDIDKRYLNVDELVKAGHSVSNKERKAMNRLIEMLD